MIKLLESIKNSKIKLPLTMYILISSVFIVIFIGIIISIVFKSVFSNYIENECQRRINSAFQTYADIFNLKDNDDIDFSNNILDEIVIDNLKAADTVMNEASIILINRNSNEFYLNDKWQSISSIPTIEQIYNYSQPFISKITIDKNIYYCKMVPLSSLSNLTTQNSKFSLLFYVDTRHYYTFSEKILSSLLLTIIIFIFIAILVGLTLSFPIIMSIFKLSKFAKQISNNNFSPIKGFILSRELTELSQNMNFMAQKIAKNDKEQKLFFQNASHELRTPLMSIQGYAEGIKYDVFNEEEKKKGIDIIISESERLTAMVDNLLKISKLDLNKNGEYEINKKKNKLIDIFNQEIKNIQGNFLYNDKKLITNIDFTNEIFYCNKVDILKMIDNILSNAVRYAKKNVYLNAYMQNYELKFIIYDDGDGIKDEFMDKIFERFSKGETGRHGIGLSLVKSIVDSHNGKIDVYNKDGFGACFEITFPYVNPNFYS